VDIDDYGTLVNDPSFLALAKMGSGASTASMLGGAGGGLFELGPIDFRVQRGQPYTFWKQGQFHGDANLPEMVDRVEIEFTYR